MRRFMLFLLLSLPCICQAEDFLAVEKAFVPAVKTLSSDAFCIVFTIHPGYFLYNDKFHLKNVSSEIVTVESLTFSAKHLIPIPRHASTPHGRENAMVLPDKKPMAYRDKALLCVQARPLKPGQQILKLGYQGCSARGYCYPPQTLLIKLRIDRDLQMQSKIVSTDRT